MAGNPGKGDPELPVQERSPRPSNSCPAPAYVERLRGAWLMKQRLQTPPLLKKSTGCFLMQPDAGASGMGALLVRLCWDGRQGVLLFGHDRSSSASFLGILVSYSILISMSVSALFGVFCPRRCNSPKP